jgi:hypothetical protein
MMSWKWLLVVTASRLIHHPTHPTAVQIATRIDRLTSHGVVRHIAGQTAIDRARSGIIDRITNGSSRVRSTR